MSVATLDFDTEYWNIVNRLTSQHNQRLAAPVVKIHDGNWVLRGQAGHIYAASFTEIENETGMASFTMPENYYLSKWIVDHDGRATKNVHVSMEKDGVRWTGRMDRYEIETGNDGKTVVRVIVKHDYEEFKHIIAWANPFLPAEVQFPKLWLLFGSAKWCLKTTLFVNILRLEASLWMLPNNPLDIHQWFNLDQSTWSMVVKPDDGSPDNSPLAVCHSRFKYFHDVSKPIAEDAQLTPVFRRFFDGDDPPWPGADLRHGCLVIDYEDNSGWNTGTSFGGDFFTGLIHAIVDIGSDGYTEGIDIISDPAWPDEYHEPGWMGTFPQAPGIIYRTGEHTGIQTSLFTGSPAKDRNHVAGGHSMPGVNELISAAIQMAGDLIGALFGLSGIGSVADAILQPLYKDVLLAWQAWGLPDRANDLGNSYYHERIAEGADRAYSLKALIALRTSIWATRETFTHRLTVADGRPWIVGARGQGHYYLGHRIGSTVKGAPLGKIYVDRVSQVSISWDRTKAPTWEVIIGEREHKDPVLKALEKIQELASICRDLGVL